METHNFTHATMLLSADDMLLAAVSTEDLTLLKHALASSPESDSKTQALMLACASNRYTCLLELLRAGVSPTRNAMWAACREGHELAVKALKDHGCIFAQIERSICIRHGHMHMAELFI